MWSLLHSLPARSLGFLLAASPLAASAQSDPTALPELEDYVLRAWDVEDGLPNNNIQGLVQTPNGYLWIATWNGIAQFDGLRFTTFSKGTSPALPANEVNALLAATDGTLWAGLQNGELVRYSAGAFQVIASPDSRQAADPILTLAEGGDGSIWAAFVPTPKVLRWKAGALTPFFAQNGLGPGRFPYLYAAADGTIWFGTSEGCGFFDEGRFQQFPASDGNDVRLGRARSGGMWVARGHQLFHYWKNGAREVVADLTWLGGSGSITAILEDAHGNIWIGTRNAGLIRFHDGKFERAPTSSSSILALFEDRQGNIWAGTRGGGLNRLSPRCFFLRKAQGPDIRDDTVSSLAVDVEGRICLAQGRALVRAVDDRNLTFARMSSTSPILSVLVLLSDPASGIWLGGQDHTIQCWWNGKYTTDERFPGSINSFLKDRRQNLWIASTRNGLYLRRDGVTTRVAQEDLLEPRALAEDSEGRVWVGTESGPIFRQDGDRFLPVPLPGAKPGERAQFIVSDGKGAVWIGAFEGGLYRWRAGRVEKFPSDAGLPVNDLKALEIEPGGNFWFGTGQGLFRVANAEIEAVLAGRQRAVRATSYGRNDGLPPLNFYYGFLHSNARTPDGHLWFGTTAGALEIAPAKLPSPTSANPVLIEEFQANDKPVPIPRGQTRIVLPPQPGQIQIRYTMPQIDAPEQLRFRYRLLGSGNDDWYAVGNQRTAVFTNLSPGNYVFEVATSEFSGPSKTALLAFIVRAAWWETIWFRLGCAVIGAIALATLVRAIVKRRMQARIRRLEQDHALERERSRIARDMHDELGASLTHIMLMSEVAASEPNAADLRKIAQTARTVSSTLDQIVWTTNPRNDTLEHLIGYIAEFAEEYLATTDIVLRLELPPEIPVREVSAEKRHQVLLVVKEALNNIVKHAGAGRIHLHIALGPDVLRIVIRDDGKGFDPGAISPTSNGLANMRQRLAAIGGTTDIESQPGHGTTVTLSANF